MRQTAVQPEECWYGDTEWNVSLWGTYAFADNDDAKPDLDSFINGPANDIRANGDKYLGDDEAWGGGADIKYFWHKYFGFGVEGFILDSHRTRYQFDSPDLNTFTFTTSGDDRIVGSVLGTITLRYPIGCSRFAPYVWAGGGGIFGGGERDHVFFVNDVTGAPVAAHTSHSDSESRALGQFGGGIEIRITRHIGWLTDFSWNVVDGPHNNFGMVRAGLNFAF